MRWALGVSNRVSPGDSSYLYRSGISGQVKVFIQSNRIAFHYVSRTVWNTWNGFRSSVSCPNNKKFCCQCTAVRDCIVRRWCHSSHVHRWSGCRIRMLSHIIIVDNNWWDYSIDYSRCSLLSMPIHERFNGNRTSAQVCNQCLLQWSLSSNQTPRFSANDENTISRTLKMSDISGEFLWISLPLSVLFMKVYYAQMSAQTTDAGHHLPT